ncbi:MAG TPA: iron-sulfur cluster repair di-iron protein [Bacteroidales bacterium]|jgi:regulator of cell morphogenesis and NO signaling|nr:iron-sulfur cluster repair di-iron protein [Bacteroidales bacterium]
MKETEMKTYTVGEIVASDYRAAKIFKEAGIDFCCGGKKTLEETCAAKGIDPDALWNRLENLGSEPSSANHNFNEWEPGFLCDYIVNVHHVFVRNTLPELMFYTNKIAKVHGENHPELYEVADLFSQVNNELAPHLTKEENILFPAVKEFHKSGSEKSASVIKNEMENISAEHESAGAAMDKINFLTDGYSVPEDACNSYRLALTMLEKFEDDLHTHVHLENNILFPKTLEKIN